MKKEKSSSLILAKVWALLVTAGLCCLFFLSQERMGGSVFEATKTWAKNTLENISDFEINAHAFYLPFNALIVAFFALFSLFFLLARKPQKAAKSYRTVSVVFALLALINFYYDATAILHSALGGALPERTDVLKLIKELVYLSATQVFLVAIGNLLIGSFFFENKKNAAIKLVYLVLTLLPVLATAFSVFEEVSAPLSSSSLFLKPFYDVKENFFDTLIPAVAKSELFATVGIWLYRAVFWVSLANLVASVLFLYHGKSAAFNRTRFGVQLVLTLGAFFYPLIGLKEVTSLFDVYYWVALGAPALCILISVVFERSAKEKKEETPEEEIPVLEEVTAEPVYGEEVSEPASEPEQQIILDGGDFEIGKQMPSDAAYQANTADDTIAPSFVSTNIGTEEAPVQQSIPTETVQTLPAVEDNATDEFLQSLTPQERKEFRMLFVDDSPVRNARLPQYVIGGDNRAFFRRVFIYVGRFRSYISASLLEKLYLQSTSVNE